MGFSDSMNGPAREAAQTEAEFVNYIFTDAQGFLRDLIAAMMDEPSTKESLVRVVRKINKSLPFLLLNDYRIAHASNSLQRVEVVKALLASGGGDG